MINVNTAKYMKYAIGEIVLVVIGILIALQINNWNEEKKAKSFEVKMLNEIRKDLIQDTIYFNMIKKRAELAFNAANKMMGIMYSKDETNDSILIIGKEMFIKFQFNYHKGSYEAIKSTGMDRISNDSLRNQLTDMYDFVLPRVMKFLTDNRSKEKEESDVFEFIKMGLVKLPNGKFIPKPSVRENFSSNESSIIILMSLLADNQEAISRLDNLTRNCSRLLGMLDRELQIENVMENIPKNRWETGEK